LVVRFGERGMRCETTSTFGYHSNVEPGKYAAQSAPYFGVRPSSCLRQPRASFVDRRAGRSQPGLRGDDLDRILLAVVDREVAAVGEVAEPGWKGSNVVDSR
jgi:hypothetical protein